MIANTSNQQGIQQPERIQDFPYNTIGWIQVQSSPEKYVTGFLIQKYLVLTSTRQISWFPRNVKYFFRLIKKDKKNCLYIKEYPIKQIIPNKRYNQIRKKYRELNKQDSLRYDSQNKALKIQSIQHNFALIILEKPASRPQYFQMSQCSEYEIKRDTIAITGYQRFVDQKYKQIISIIQPKRKIINGGILFKVDIKEDQRIGAPLHVGERLVGIYGNFSSQGPYQGFKHFATIFTSKMIEDIQLMAKSVKCPYKSKKQIPSIYQLKLNNTQKTMNQSQYKQENFDAQQSQDDDIPLQNKKLANTLSGWQGPKCSCKYLCLCLTQKCSCLYSHLKQKFSLAAQKCFDDLDASKVCQFILAGIFPLIGKIIYLISQSPQIDWIFSIISIGFIGLYIILGILSQCCTTSEQKKQKKIFCCQCLRQMDCQKGFQLIFIGIFPVIGKILSASDCSSNIDNWLTICSGSCVAVFLIIGLIFNCCKQKNKHIYRIHTELQSNNVIQDPANLANPVKPATLENRQRDLELVNVINPTIYPQEQIPQ